MMKWLDHLEEWLIATFMGAATLITFIAVLHRYLVGFESPLQNWLLGLNFAWAQEATIYLFVWMASSAPPTACAPASTWGWTC
jgi:C4-dicarboxylate transporter DctQ subunit